ncbi:MAG TPA: nicotinate (nicotinamide) nucleotide adenylyltransferase [Prevotellaceae bacterium]|nr:nicotinate (nicotinamide) nucleotide adenylyltransferase [Prevotellaceae bacterium]
MTVRTGVYGGSFNPIHNGHVSLAQHLIQEGLVDEVWLVVSPQNPFKADSTLLDEQLRLRLARLAVAGEPGIRVSDVEFSLPRPSFMSATLRALSARCPQRQFSLIMGADNWERFAQWHESRWIQEHYPLIVFPRPGHPLGTLPQGVQRARTPLLDISSSWIRGQLPSPAYRGEGLPPKVWREIRALGLYHAFQPGREESGP